MTNENNPHNPEQELLAKINKDKKNRRIWTGVVFGLLVALILCALLAFTLGKKLVGRVVTGRENSTELIDNFFTAMNEKDIEAVQGLLSAQGKKTYPPSELEDLFDGGNFVFFDGYQDFTMTDFYSGTSTEKGTYQEINGVINYEHGFTGKFYFYLQKDNGEWKITEFGIRVPPEKMEYYLEHE